MNFEELFGNFVTESVPMLAVSSTKLKGHKNNINTAIDGCIDAGNNHKDYCGWQR